MNITGIIPARMASSRFPGKPLNKIAGIPLVGHVYYRSKMCGLLKEVYIATCDREIAEYAQSIGAQAIMTSAKHQRASDRTAEAVAKIEKKTRKKIDIVAMIQGDEPMIYPQMIEEALKPLLKSPDIQVVNLMGPLKSREEQLDPHEIKVVTDLNNFALYFSREAIPSWKKGALKAPMFKQICVIPFRREFLMKFNRLLTTPLENVESIDMLRALEHGYKVKMVTTKFATYSVDTPADALKVQGLLKNDPLLKLYK